MRAILSAALAAGFAASASAAEYAPPRQAADYVPPRQQDTSPAAGRGEFYWMHLIRLKKEVDRMVREDGGQLTPEHQADLQKRLDDLNRRYLPLASRRDD